MAVGVIIGGAFGKIVTSLVNDIIMPALGLLIGNISFSELTVGYICSYRERAGHKHSLRGALFKMCWISLL